MEIIDGPERREEPTSKRKRKVAIFVLADTESHGETARWVNTLEAAKEFREA